jgi:hypothetical protein
MRRIEGSVRSRADDRHRHGIEGATANLKEA